MPKKFNPTEGHATAGRTMLSEDRSLALDPCVDGTTEVLGAMVAAGAHAFKKPVRDLVVIATAGAVNVAKSAAALAGAMDGSNADGPWLVPAGQTRTFPLWQDEFAVSGACYVEGRI